MSDIGSSGGTLRPVRARRPAFTGPLVALHQLQRVVQHQVDHGGPDQARPQRGGVDQALAGLLVQGQQQQLGGDRSCHRWLPVSAFSVDTHPITTRPAGASAARTTAGHPVVDLSSQVVDGRRTSARKSRQPGSAIVLIAGQVDVEEVMGGLAESRPVFHSEADFQCAFSQHVEALAPGIRCRLEVPQARTADDLATSTSCASAKVLRPRSSSSTFTRPWSGEAGQPPELYNLRGHAATDLARLNFVHDIRRLEHMVARGDVHGLAIMLTNERRLREPPDARRKPTNDVNFAIHDGISD